MDDPGADGKRVFVLKDELEEVESESDGRSART